MLHHFLVLSGIYQFAFLLVLHVAVVRMNLVICKSESESIFLQFTEAVFSSIVSGVHCKIGSICSDNVFINHNALFLPHFLILSNHQKFLSDLMIAIFMLHKFPNEWRNRSVVFWLILVILHERIFQKSLKCVA